MSLQGMNNVLSNFKSSKNISLSTQVIRKSMISNAVENCQDLEEVTTTLAHDPYTALKY